MWDPTGEALNVQIPGGESVGFDEIPPGLHFVAHQRGEDFVRCDGVFYPRPHQPPHLRVHGGLPELFRVHFSQALVALDRDALAGFVKQPVHGLPEFLHGFLLLPLPDRGAFSHQGAQYLAGFPDLGVIVALQEMRVDLADVRVTVAYRPDFKAITFLDRIVFRPDLDVLSGKEGDQRLRTLDGGGFVGEVDFRSLEQHVEHLRFDQMGEPCDDGFRQQVFLGDFPEGFPAYRSIGAGRNEFRVLKRLLHQELLKLKVVLQIALLLAVLDLVKRRLRDVDMAALDQFGHLSVEEGEQQGADMGAVDVRVGHDDDAVVAQLVGIVFVLADSRAERGDQGDDLLGGDDLLESRLLDIEDLALERQYRLEFPVAPLLCRPSRGISLHQIDFRKGGVLFLAVGELARQTQPVERPFPAGELARLPGGLPRSRRVDDLGDDQLGVGRVFQEEFGKGVGNHFLDQRTHFGRNQLVLGLGRELGVRKLDRKNRGQSFPHVVPGGLGLGLLCGFARLDVMVERPGHCRAQRSQMGSAVALGNVVGEAEHGFLIRIVPLHGDLDGDAFLFGRGMEDFGMEDVLVSVDVFDEAPDSAGEGEILFLSAPEVGHLDLDAVVQEGKLPEPLGQDVVMVFDVAEHFPARQEMDFSAVPVALPGHLERLDRLALAEFHLVDMPVAPDRQLEPFGERVDHGNPDSVQPARDLVGVAVELAPRVQHGHDDFRRGAPFLLVDVHGNAASVVADADRIVGMDDHVDVVAVAGERLVDGVVGHLEHHVVQAAAVPGVADIHPGALAHRFETLENLDVCRIVCGHGFT